MDFEEGKYSEVIDLVNPSTSCKMLSEYPMMVAGATGGLLQGNKPLVCGGNDDNANTITQCYIVGTNDG